MRQQVTSVSQHSRYNVELHSNNNHDDMSKISEDEQLTHWLGLVAAKRDKQAFSHVFSWFSPKVLRIAAQKLNNETLANEVVQETLTNIWRKSHFFQPEKGKATTWMYTVMRNVIFDTLRKIRTQQKVCLSEDIYPDYIEQQAVEVDFKDHLQDDQLMKIVDSLPINQQEVVKAIYFQELTQEQLAKQLNIPLGTVKSRLRLALSKLKIQLGDQHD